jgi:hypothetical protein
LEFKIPNTFLSFKENFLSSTIKVKRGETYTKSIRLELKDLNSGIISVNSSVIEPQKGYRNISNCFLNIEFDGSSSMIHSSIANDSIYYATRSKDKEFFKLDDRLAVGNQLKSGTTHIVQMSGTVKYEDIQDNYHRLEPINKCKVHLYFKDNQNPNSLYHPFSGSNIENVTYSTIDNNGSFNFNFEFNADVSGMEWVYLLVEPTNDYIRLYPDHYYVVGTSSGSTTVFGISEGVCLPITSTDFINNNLNITINSQDGAILNNMQKAGEYLNEIYSGSIPFTLEKIPVFRRQADNLAYFRPTPINVNVYNPYPLVYSSMGFSSSIVIDNDLANFPDISFHEYGHYVQFRMWNGDGFDGEPNEIDEGWAIFYSFASAEYCVSVYGDSGYDLLNDDAEIGSYTNPRFSGMSYGISHPTWPAFACYLYNLYDGYDDGIFELSKYRGLENDDVYGYRRRVFDVMAAVVAPSSGGFNTRFKNGLNTNLQNSVQKIYNFMMLSNNPNPLPAQVNNFNLTTLSSTSIKLSWFRRDYQVSWGNLPQGYRIYTRSAIANPWLLLTSLPLSTTAHILSTTSPKSLDYKITSYNSTGESYDEQYIKYLLSVGISGPSSIVGPSSGYYTGSATGGAGYNYKWSVRYNSGEPYFDIGYSKNLTFHPDFSYSSAELLLQVTCGEQRGSAIKTVQLSGTGGPIEMIAFGDVVEESSSIYSENLADEADKINFSLSPNPAVTMTKISATNGSKISSVILLNSSGIILQNHQSINANEFTIDVSNLITGVYKVQVKIDGVFSSQILVKQ